jgi:hypothetical protein
MVANVRPEDRKGFGDIMRMLASRWKEMTDEEKKPYNDRF